MPKKLWVIALLAGICFLFGGCAMLNLPFQMLGMAGNLLGQGMNLLGKLPMPPPWVFF